MGATITRKLEAKPEEFTTEGYFTTDELEAVDKAFAGLAEPSGRITQEQFLSVLPLPGQMGRNLFHVLDEDNNGTIDKHEYLLALRMLLRSDEDEKLRVLFDLFRGDADVVSLDAMKDLLRSTALASLRIIRAVENGTSVREAADASTPTPATLGSPGAATSPSGPPEDPRMAALRPPPPARTDSAAEREEMQAITEELAEEAFAAFDTSGGLSFPSFRSWVLGNSTARELLDVVFEIARGQHLLLMGPTEDDVLETPKPKPLSPTAEMYHGFP